MCIRDRIEPYYRLLARELATRLKLDNPGEAATLDQVVGAYLAKPGSRRQSVYRELGDIAGKLSVEIPEPLLQLASIRDLNLYVSFSTDNLLAQAINAARFSGRAETRELSFNPSAVSYTHLRPCIEHCRARNHDGRLRCTAHKSCADKHARQKTHSRIGHVHMDWNRARLRIGGRLDKVDTAVDGLVGHRLCCDVNFLTLLNLRQLLLIDIGLDPDLAEIGNSKQRVACVDVQMCIRDSL